jgi:hypothetical protein
MRIEQEWASLAVPKYAWVQSSRMAMPHHSSSGFGDHWTLVDCP